MATPIIFKTNATTLYFASDFHLGTPNAAESLAREKKIVHWLDDIAPTAAAIFLVGDIFDFWFEYKHTIPKGFVRLQGKITALTDAGIPVYFFTGNHDLWMRTYFEEELGVKIFHEPQIFRFGKHSFYVGHGDGLGPGDFTYKKLKKIFTNRIAQWAFGWLHPNIGIALAQRWSSSSRITNIKKGEEHFLGKDSEWLFQYCLAMEQQHSHDFYVFGHRHLPLNMAINSTSRYINLGEWVFAQTYASYNGTTNELELLSFGK